MSAPVSDLDLLAGLLKGVRIHHGIPPHFYWCEPIIDPRPATALMKIAAARITELKAALAERDVLVEALTPSGETKAAYMGEFSFPFKVFGPEGEVTYEATVPWTTIKEIMAAIRSYGNKEDLRETLMRMAEAAKEK